jgi:hypothetical protein
MEQNNNNNNSLKRRLEIENVLFSDVPIEEKKAKFSHEELVDFLREQRKRLALAEYKIGEIYIPNWLGLPNEIWANIIEYCSTATHEEKNVKSLVLPQLCKQMKGLFESLESTRFTSFLKTVRGKDIALLLCMAQCLRKSYFARAWFHLNVWPPVGVDNNLDWSWGGRIYFTRSSEFLKIQFMNINVGTEDFAVYSLGYSVRDNRSTYECSISDLARMAPQLLNVNLFLDDEENEIYLEPAEYQDPDLDEDPPANDVECIEIPKDHFLRRVLNSLNVIDMTGFYTSLDDSRFVNDLLKFLEISNTGEKLW